MAGVDHWCSNTFGWAPLGRRQRTAGSKRKVEYETSSLDGCEKAASLGLINDCCRRDTQRELSVVRRKTEKRCYSVKDSLVG